MRFDQFMNIALYDPERGYYKKRIRTVGEKGDFSTSASLSPILGEALYNYLKSYLKKNSLAWNVIECGAGSGALAETIINHCSFFERRKINYHIVESSPKLRDQQMQLLSKKANWHESLSDALNACNGNAFCFSNELVDAFPVRVFRKEEVGWSELYLITEQQISERFDPIENKDLPESSIFNQDLTVGQRVEVHESYNIWLQQHISQLAHGCLFTIDYGDIDKQIYHRRPNGTLRAYAHHQRFEGQEIYQNPGHQDITCDINFTDLQHWGEHGGLKTIDFLTQREFMISYSKKRDLASSHLLSEDGAGSSFKVLIQEKVTS